MKKGGWFLVNYESVTCENYDYVKYEELRKQSNSAQINIATYNNKNTAVQCIIKCV